MSQAISIRVGALLLASMLGAGAAQAQNLRAADINAALDAAYNKYRTLQEGANADYIPALAKVDPSIFGIAVISPPLDAAGNSVRAQRAIADISNALGGNPFAPRPR
jgi:glutaminase